MSGKGQKLVTGQSMLRKGRAGRHSRLYLQQPSQSTRHYKAITISAFAHFRLVHTADAEHAFFSPRIHRF